MTPAPIFLTAQWSYLAMLNYEVDPAVLAPFIPAGTELDTWNGRAFVSMVGFLFEDTRVRGIAIPFHRNFEEVNLRFYVRRPAPDGWRRAVVFVKELVPRRAIAWIARTVYNENYKAVPMSHRIGRSAKPPHQVESVSYEWKFKGQSHHIRLQVTGEPLPLMAGSEEEFITEHYWGYAAQKDGSTVEYQVEHPRWRVWQGRDVSFVCDVAGLYGPAFANYLNRPPSSAFLAEGSAITVRKGVRL